MLKVSIIVPVYNVKDYLRECLDSLAGQTLDSYEVILVNDGSTDGSDLICKEYAEKYPNFKLYSQENQGQSAARNHGMTFATGEYILFVDSDDFIVDDACSVLYENAKKHDADIVIGDILNEKQIIEKDVSFRYIPSENQKISTRQYCEETFLYNVYDIIPTVRIVRKSYLDKNNIKFLNGCFYEDHEYSMRLFTVLEGTVVKIRFPFYYYRMDRPGSTTNYASAKKGNDFIKVLKKMEENMDNLSDDMYNAGFNILGLAYFHFASLWLRIRYSEAKAIQKEFVEILDKSLYSEEAVKCLNANMKKIVDDVRNRPMSAKFKWKTKEIIKNIMRK